MLDIPYEKNRGNACALSCYTMTARYFFPEITFEQIAEISNWRPGYVIWGFKFWLWIMNRGIKVTNFDLINLKKWADDGFESLKDSLTEKEYQFFLKATYNIDEYSDDIKKTLSHPNFIFRQKRPEWDNLVKAFDDGAVCEVILDSNVLDNKKGKLDLHRVVVLDMRDEQIIFHDPRTDKYLSQRMESIEIFKKAWLDALDSPELCIYKK